MCGEGLERVVESEGEGVFGLCGKGGGGAGLGCCS